MPHFLKSKLTNFAVKDRGYGDLNKSKEDAEYYDFLILMDGNNSRNFHRLFGSAFDDKLSLLLSWAGENRSIADPWYSGNFEETWNDVNLGCKALLEKLIPIKQ
mgnify:CR=1 FL=1